MTFVNIFWETIAAVAALHRPFSFHQILTNFLSRSCQEFSAKQVMGIDKNTP